MTKTKNKSYKKKSYKKKIYKKKSYKKNKTNKTKKRGGDFNTMKTMGRIAKDGISNSAILLTDATAKASTTAAGAILKSVLLSDKLIAFATKVTSESTSAIYLAISTPLSVFIFVTSQIKKLTDITSIEIKGIIDEINTLGATSQLDISKMNTLIKRIPTLYDKIINDAIKGMISLVQSYKKVAKNEIELFNKGLNHINCKRSMIKNVLSPLDVRSSCIPLKVENTEEQNNINKKYDRMKFLFKNIIKYFNDKQIIMKNKIENQRTENRTYKLKLNTNIAFVRNLKRQGEIINIFDNICNTINKNTDIIDSLAQYNSDEVYIKYNEELTKLISDISFKLYPVPEEEKEEQKKEIDSTLEKTEPSAEQIKKELFNEKESEIPNQEGPETQPTNNQGNGIELQEPPRMQPANQVTPLRVP